MNKNATKALFVVCLCIYIYIYSREEFRGTLLVHLGLSTFRRTGVVGRRSAATNLFAKFTWATGSKVCRDHFKCHKVPQQEHHGICMKTCKTTRSGLVLR